MAWKADEKDFYAKRMDIIKKEQETYRLTSKEKAYWEQKEENLEKPFSYTYKTGYSILISSVYLIAAFTILLIAVCLSGIFAEEHSFKTDQLILSSEQGKHTLYLAKLLAGISFSVGATMITSALAFLLALGIYGTDGFDGAIQLVRPSYSYPISVGKFALILYGILILVAIITGVCIMILSEVLRNSLATLAIAVVSVLLGLFANIPEQYRILSQIWDLLPGNLLFAGNIFDIRLISILGNHYTAWQVMPLIYLLAAIFIAVIGKPIYEKCPVK